MSTNTPPIGYSTREKVSILSVCEANCKDARARIEEAMKAEKEAEALVAAIKSKQTSELQAAEAELNEIASLIKANERQEVPTEKLEKKASEIRNRIVNLASEHSGSKELAAACECLERASNELKDAQEHHEISVMREKLAEKLKIAHEIDARYGAVEAPVYQTLEEAIDDYLASMPLHVHITAGLSIDKVGMWQVPNASTPLVREVFASKGVSYRYNRLPAQLEWICKFPGSPYGSMPKSSATLFNIDDVMFVVNQENHDVVADDAQQHAWMGKMADRFKTDTHTLFAPMGINYRSESSFYTDSGMCYVRSTGMFYALWPDKIPFVEMVKGKVKQTRRTYTGYEEEVEVDGMVRQTSDLEATKLFEPFFPPLRDVLNSSIKEFSDLSKAVSPLALRLKAAIEKVGVVESSFEHRGKRLSEAEAIKEFGMYWDAFVNSPWEASINGDVAMIKHLCQRNIERPHVWSWALKGHYGLRVRTRDHDWILAQAYCPPESLSPKKTISADDVQYQGRLVRVGPCFIQVIGRER